MFERFAQMADSDAVTLSSGTASRPCAWPTSSPFLDDGRIEEVGSHDALMAAGGRYAELFRLQASRY